MSKQVKRSIASKSNPFGKHGNSMCSGYQIYWGIITASKGIATVQDVKTINATAKKLFGTSLVEASRNIWHPEKIMVLPVRDKSKIETLFENLSKSGKLSKSYDCVIITDKQFGKGSIPTAKQRTNMVTIH